MSDKWPTEAMIEAGLRAGSEARNAWAERDDAIAAIYLAMEAARDAESAASEAEDYIRAVSMNEEQITQAALGPVPSWPK